ncbi:1-acyl-sn-glycerol-3-phosphate acyltransferase [Lachnospiraceae bacterium XBB1006]|nr:1-acyl-sn-glycerol-3-phosphate acyltransferase [Lachnospiraceae bacterium XBB1006]
MLRILYTILRNVFHLYMIPLMRYVGKHPEKYTEEKRYRLVRRLSRLVTRAGHIHTRYYGLENIPKGGNYILCANHQGKFDALAIVNGHERPCSLVMDYERSQMYVVNEIMTLLQGKRLKRNDVRQAMTIIMEMAEELKSGKKFIIFPEGGYRLEKENHLYPFKPGCFKSVQKAHSQIVPVVIIDSYKAYKYNSLRRVYNEVYFLKPISYNEISGLKTQDIAQLVQARIGEKILEVTDIKEDELFIRLDSNTVLI